MNTHSVMLFMYNSHNIISDILLKTPITKMKKLNFKNSNNFKITKLGFQENEV